MKTGTIKTIGAAALGVAFAALSAGSAIAEPAAAPAGLPIPAADPGSLLDKAGTILPVDKLSHSVPGAGEGTEAVKNVVRGTHTGPLDPTSLLGGLPTNALPLGQLAGGIGH